MGLFSRKPSLTPEEITSRMDEIDALYVEEKYDEAFAAATALEKEAKGYGAYHLAMGYHLGWGVEENADRALSYYNSAVSTLENGYLKSAWYMGGLLLLNVKDDYEQSLKWLEKAEALGESDASMFIACDYFYLSMNCRNLATRTLKMNELTQLNALATQYALRAQDKYLEVANSNPSQLTYDHWVCLGRCVQLLYNLACRGELSMDIVDDNSAKSWIKNSFSMVSGTMNTELHEKMLNNAAYVCDVMGKCGYEIIGEYFRAACGLLDSEIHHSAEAFYRVRWHMKKIGELRQNCSEAAEIADMMSDVDESYKKMDKKYGNMVISMIREGRLPDLTPSYPKDAVPAPESCQNFMDMFQQIRSAPTASAAPEKKEKKGLFGFFKR